jgi:hypothetical protein
VPTTPETPATHSSSWPQVLAFRLRRQGVIERAPASDLVGMVGRMAGLHAQVMSSAELQAAIRIDGLHPADVRSELWDRRRLVKTWTFRQTLHLLTADDYAEFVVAARSLERWHTPAWLRYFKMTEEGVAEVIDAIGDVLSDRPMTRMEVVDAVVERVRRPQLRDDMLTGWGTFLGPAAQRGRLVFGPSEGRNVAFVNPSAWLGRPIGPGTDELAADEALARLIERNLVSFPASSREMIARWWGGGRLAAVTRSLKLLNGRLVEVDIEGVRGLVRERDLAELVAASPDHEARLLPGFDPFTNELPRRLDSVLAPADHDAVHRIAGWVTPIVAIDGRIGGTWEIGPVKGGVSGKGGAGSIVVRPFFGWRGGARRELEREVDRIAAFLDRPLRLEIMSGG